MTTDGVASPSRCLGSQAGMAGGSKGIIRSSPIPIQGSGSGNNSNGPGSGTKRVLESNTPRPSSLSWRDELDPTPGRLPRTKNDEFLLQLSGSPAWPPPLLSGTEDEGVFGSASSSLTSLLLHGPPGVSHPWKNSQTTTRETTTSGRRDCPSSTSTTLRSGLATSKDSQFSLLAPHLQLSASVPMPHNPYASFASPMDSQDSKDTLFDLESHPSYETPSLLSGGRKGLQRKTSSPPQPPSSLTASYMPFTNDRVWSNSYGSSSLNGGESFLSHPNAHNLLRVPQQQQHFHQGKSAQQSVNNSLRMSSSVQSSSLLLSASYQSEQSFTENLASSSSLKMQSFVVSGRDSIPVLAEDDVEQHKKLVDEITEDVEDGCPVVKVPRRMYNGLSGTMTLPKRQWKKQCQSEIDSRHFMVMSYNLLAPFYCTSAKYPLTKEEHLDWEYRRRQILDEVAYYSPDFVCFQELPTSEYATHFLAELQTMGYHGHFQKKKREHAADGCAIFYQTCRFTLIDVQAFAYNERIPADMPEDLRARLSPFSNIALVCIFQNRQSRSQKVRMVTTHLHWDPAFADIKLLQASLLIEWLESTNATIPTVIAGDFNSKPGEPVMDYLVRGKVCLSKPKTEHPGESGGEAVPVGPDPAIAKAVASARSTSPVLMDNLSVAEIESEDAKNRMNAFAIQRQGVKLASAYNTRDLPFTNKTPDFEGVIDHILYSSGTLSIRDVLCDVYIPELVSASASPTEGMSPPTASSSVPFLGDEKLSSAIPSEHLHIAQYGMSSYLTRLPSLPSRRFPSDHVSLCAWLKWKTVPVLSGAQKPHQGGSSFGVNKKMSARVHGSEAAGRGLSQSVPASTTSWVSLEDFHRNQGVPAHRGQGGRSSNANNKGNEHKSSRKQLYNPSAHKDLDSMGMSGLSLDPTQVYPGSYNPQQQGQFTYQPQHQGVPHGQQGRRRGSNASATSNPGLTHQGSYPSTAQGFFQQHPQQQHQQQQGHPHASHKKF